MADSSQCLLLCQTLCSYRALESTHFADSRSAHFLDTPRENHYYFFTQGTPFTAEPKKLHIKPFPQWFLFGSMGRKGHKERIIMFGFGMPQILIILAIALIIFGPQKLPELARTLGKALADFKRAANDFKYSIEEEARIEEEREVSLKEAESGKDVSAGNNEQAETEEKVS
jgi:sec-independent protein translocase protein TatA